MRKWRFTCFNKFENNPFTKNDYFRYMKIKEVIQRKLSDFVALCKKYNVERLYAFGSATTKNFDENTSDIDLLIEINNKDAITRGESLLSIWDEFEVFFQRKVDLLTSTSIRNPILKKHIDATKILIYDREKQEIPL